MLNHRTYPGLPHLCTKEICLLLTFCAVSTNQREEECCDADDIIQATIRARAQARDILVETDDRLLNIAEVLIHVHRLRQVDISSTEH